MKCFVEGAPCEMDTSSGFKYCHRLIPPCAVLMADIASQRPWGASLAEVDKAWQRLNANRRVDSFRVDGDGLHPVKWNFRLASIANCARQYHGLEIIQS